MIRLRGSQWAAVLAEHGDGGDGAAPAVVKSNEIVFLLALEADAPDTELSWWGRALDVVVRTMQPSPALKHVELIVPVSAESVDTEIRTKDDVHFATYLGEKAKWGSKCEGNVVDYYTNHDKSWRAVPVMARDAIARLRTECDKNVGTPYPPAKHLYNYPYSVPPLRSRAYTLPDEPLEAAHCAALTARCLRAGLPELNLPRRSAWCARARARAAAVFANPRLCCGRYGPSTLFLELTRGARIRSYGERLAAMDTKLSTKEMEDAEASEETLLRGSNEEVCGLSETVAQAGIDRLCRRCMTVGVTTTDERQAQKALARALLRESQIARPHRRLEQQRQQLSAAPAPEQPAPEQPAPAPEQPAPGYILSAM